MVFDRKKGHTLYGMLICRLNLCSVSGFGWSAGCLPKS